MIPAIDSHHHFGDPDRGGFTVPHASLLNIAASANRLTQGWL